MKKFISVETAAYLLITLFGGGAVAVIEWQDESFAIIVLRFLVGGAVIGGLSYMLVGGFRELLAKNFW